jgi:ABC-type cobalt transport system substrate-binding protein
MMVIVMIVIRISILTVTVNDGDYYYGIDNEDNKNNDEVIGTLISTDDILVIDGVSEKYWLLSER